MTIQEIIDSLAAAQEQLKRAIEGLYALKKISRNDERGYHAADTPVRRPAREQAAEADPMTRAKKKYYN